MMAIRAAAERGHANHRWLDAWFTFSFANYFDRNWMGYRALRVINDDVVQPAHGFGKHPHDNMEILTYMISGSLSHNDSTGGSGAIVPGELQHMSAGTGVYHSEQNASTTEASHSLQIWLEPNTMNVAPRYQQKKFNVAEEPDTFHLLASKDGRGESFHMYADAELLAAKLSAGGKAEHTMRAPYGWLHVVQGDVTLGGVTLKGGDGVALKEEKDVKLTSENGGEVLLFDLD